MTSTDEVLEMLSELRDLLRSVGNELANAIDRVGGEIVRDPASGRVTLKRMFGGMGSLNDLVLHRNRVPLRSENDALDALRSRLGDAIASWYPDRSGK